MLSLTKPDGYRVCVAAAVVLLFAACGGGTGGGLAGMWEIDADATLAGLPDADASGGEEGMRTRMLRAMIGNMNWRIVLHPDGGAVLVLDDGDGRELGEGRWELTDDTVRIVYRSRGRDIERLARIAGGKMTLGPDDDGQPAIVLARSDQFELIEPPALGPLRPDCAESSPGGNDQLAGLSVGMSYDDARAVLECRDDVRVLQDAPLWATSENYGIETRGLMRATDGFPCTDFEAPACDTSGRRLPPVRGLTNEYVIGFTGMPGEEIARVLWQHRRFESGQPVPISDLVNELSERYGPPQIQAAGSHLRLNNLRPGTTHLVWARGPDGNILAEPRSQFNNAARHFEECINGPQPSLLSSQRWNSGCGLTIRAEIVPSPGNSLAASEFNVIVMHQRDLFHGNQQFQHALKLRGEELLRQGSGT